MDSKIVRKLLAVGLVLLFSLVVLGGPAEATHQKHVIRYIGGGSSGFFNLGGQCIGKIGGVQHAWGGACVTPCPHGTCDITVLDDHHGTDVWFSVRVNDDQFFRGNLYRHSTSFEGDFVQVSVVWSEATMGTITIE